MHIDAGRPITVIALDSRSNGCNSLRLRSAQRGLTTFPLSNLCPHYYERICEHPVERSETFPYGKMGVCRLRKSRGPLDVGSLSEQRNAGSNPVTSPSMEVWPSGLRHSHVCPLSANLTSESTQYGPKILDYRELGVRVSSSPHVGW